MGTSPQLYIVAGPNGAGKTTFANTFLPQYAKCDQFVNPDNIAIGLSPFAPERVKIKAAKILLSQIRELASKQVDFSFETTLSGLTYLKLIDQFRKQGYSIHLFYLWVPDIALALVRIKNRVKRGGHDVPSKDVRRRYKRSLLNLLTKYRPLLDSWTLFDNSSEKPKVIAKEEKGKMTVFDSLLFDKIKKVGKL